VVAGLVAESEAKDAVIAELRSEIAGLKRRLGQTSRNSSKPPSSDGLAKPVARSLRPKTGKSQGKQPGGPGTHLSMVDKPDRVVNHVPSLCSGCGKGLRCGGGDAGVVRRQVFDLPEIRPVITEHRLRRRRCRGCGQVTTAPAPRQAPAPASYGPGVTALAAYLLGYQHIPVARTAQFVADLLGLPVSTGWVAGVLSTTAAELDGFEDRVAQQLRTSPVVHVDETGIRVDGRTRWLHTASTTELTAYFLHDLRGGEAMDEFGILRDFRGVAVHDGWVSYQDFGCVHARCNAHHLRELLDAGETHPEHTWPTLAGNLLEQLNTAAHNARNTGLATIPPDILDPLISRFTRTVHLGLLLHPPSPGRKQSKTRNLLLRLRDYLPDVLRFARDLRVPFTNNQAERDLRMIKAQLKISGCWRTKTSAKTWLRVRAYISTTRKNGINTLTALHNAITGNPWLPPKPETT
jgi:transposase